MTQAEKLPSVEGDPGGRSVDPFAATPVRSCPVTLSMSQALSALDALRNEFALTEGPANQLGPVGDNASFALPAAGIVVRMTAQDNIFRVDREVRIARWAASRDLPLVRVAEEVPIQPVKYGGIAASFWRLIPGARDGWPEDIGEVLATMHSMTIEADSPLTPFDPFSTMATHLDSAAPALARADRTFLSGLLTRLKADYMLLSFQYPHVAVHGDPHRKNIIRAAGGRIVVLDLEGYGIGPREMDLIVPAVYERVGWYTPAEYSSFVEAYGYDIKQWDGFPTLAEVRELRMTLWLAARGTREPRLLPQIKHRTTSLRFPDSPRHWSPGT